MAAGTSYLEGAVADAESHIERVASDMADRGVAVTGRVCATGAADALIETAEQVEADLIVVGSRGMTGAKRLLLGSVPNGVSHHAPCSVLIVRTT
jgi:nucleotide-binding universal stress UspA family protein